MTKPNPKPKKQGAQDTDEEIDLGHLFYVLGKAISSVFAWIFNLLARIWDHFISLLLLIRANFKALAAAALLGGLMGGIYQYGIKTREFESSMTVQPNFGSSVQLYKNIDLYQSLIEQEDYDRLMESLSISEEEARSLKKIEVEPYENDNQVLLAYKDFVQNLDSLTFDLVGFEEFAKAQPEESFKYHVVTVRAIDRFVFEKLEDPLINSIINNRYYDKVKSNANENLLSKKKALESSLLELDSLRSIYKKVMIAESQQENSGTNIYLAELNASNKEVLVFDKYLSLNEDLFEVNNRLTEEREVINVVSSFNSVGMNAKGWYRNYAILGFVAGFVLVFVWIQIVRINRFLQKVEESRQS
jgi:hypothetical protein